MRCAVEEFGGLVQDREGGYEEEGARASGGEGGREGFDVGGCGWEVEVHLRGYADQAVG